MKLQDLMLSQGLSVEELAKRVGISKVYMYKIVRGDHKPSQKIIKRLSKLFPSLDEDDMKYCNDSNPLFNPIRREERAICQEIANILDEKVMNNYGRVKMLGHVLFRYAMEKDISPLFLDKYLKNIWKGKKVKMEMDEEKFKSFFKMWNDSSIDINSLDVNNVPSKVYRGFYKKREHSPPMNFPKKATPRKSTKDPFHIHEIYPKTTFFEDKTIEIIPVQTIDVEEETLPPVKKDESSLRRLPFTQRLDFIMRGKKPPKEPKIEDKMLDMAKNKAIMFFVKKQDIIHGQ